MEDLAWYFDGRPQVTGAFGDQDDHQAQATFLAKIGGTAVKGLAFANVADSSGSACILYDTLETLSQSLPRLVGIAQQSLPQPTAPPPLKWQQVPLPDGSGTVRLPEGWQVAAPEPVFKRMLPVMLEIWKSWKVSDQVLRQRLDQAAADMKEVRGIIQSVNANREWVMENANADWTEYIRGTRYERDTRTGELREQPLYDIDKTIEAKNRAEGYERYEQVPLRDLNR